MLIKKVIRKQRWSQRSKIVHRHNQYNMGDLLGNFSVNLLSSLLQCYFSYLLVHISFFPLIAANYSLNNYKQKWGWQEFYKAGMKGSFTWVILVIKLVMQQGKKKLINSTEITCASGKAFVCYTTYAATSDCKCEKETEHWCCLNYNMLSVSWPRLVSLSVQSNKKVSGTGPLGSCWVCDK